VSIAGHKHQVFRIYLVVYVLDTLQDQAKADILFIREVKNLNTPASIAARMDQPFHT
jgi:hypothetical protein